MNLMVSYINPVAIELGPFIDKMVWDYYCLWHFAGLFCRPKEFNQCRIT